MRNNFFTKENDQAQNCVAQEDGTIPLPGGILEMCGHSTEGTQYRDVAQ